METHDEPVLEAAARLSKLIAGEEPADASTVIFVFRPHPDVDSVEIAFISQAPKGLVKKMVQLWLEQA